MEPRTIRDVLGEEVCKDIDALTEALKRITILPPDYEIWTKKDGTKIKIVDMADDHLMNAMKMISRSPRFGKKDEYYKRMKSELEKRGCVVLDS